MSIARLSTQNASLIYTDGTRRTFALRDVSVELPSNKFVGIMGPSGSGKSSLLYVLSGLKSLTEGTASFGSFEYRSAAQKDIVALRRNKFGFVFQQPYLLSWQTAFENVLMGAPKLGKEAEEDARRFFCDLGIESLANKLPPQLSGGEKQRVCVARAMMNRPEVIFADEPTASLDHANGRTVVDLLARYRTSGTVVVVTHDPEMLGDADNVLLMRDGGVQGWSDGQNLQSSPNTILSAHDAPSRL